jgi:type I restriction enzyme, S subunit
VPSLPNGLGFGSTEFHVLRPSPEVLSEYLWRFVRQESYRNAAEANMTGSVGQLRVPAEYVRDSPLPLPPLDVQREILHLVDVLDNRRVSGGDHLRAARSTVGRFRQAVLAAARSGRLTADWREQHLDVESADRAIERRQDEKRVELGRRYKEPRLPDPSELPEIPETWAWATLPELGELGRGKSKHRPRNAPHLYGGPYPFIQTGDVARSGGKITSHTQTYSESGLSQSRLWPAKTVCITIAANIADTAMLTYPACFPDSVVGLVADESIACPEYVEFFIRTIRDNLEAFAPATAQANINLAILGEVTVALPPMDEQVEIVHRVELALDRVSKVEASIKASAQRLKRAGQATLVKAFRGDLSMSVHEGSQS